MIGIFPNIPSNSLFFFRKNISDKENAKLVQFYTSFFQTISSDLGDLNMTNKKNPNFRV
jgi:hypothetical protein